jgi:peptide/nickel transport system substrate-binding protein
VANFLGAVGIRARVRTMERATFMTTWREKKLKGLLIGATGAAGNAAARLEPFFTKNGMYAYGSLPEIEDLFQRQAKELDRKQRETQLHQIQKIVTDQVLAAPIFQQGFIWGVNSRVEEPAAGLIQGYPYAAPCEDMKVKSP